MTCNIPEITNIRMCLSCFSSSSLFIVNDTNCNSYTSCVITSSNKDLLVFALLSWQLSNNWASFHRWNSWLEANYYTHLQVIYRSCRGHAAGHAARKKWFEGEKMYFTDSKNVSIDNPTTVWSFLIRLILSCICSIPLQNSSKSMIASCH